MIEQMEHLSKEQAKELAAKISKLLDEYHVAFFARIAFVNHCIRCGYEWLPRLEEDGSRLLGTTKACPNESCKSPYWKQKRKYSRIKESKAKRLEKDYLVRPLVETIRRLPVIINT